MSSASTVKLRAVKSGARSPMPSDRSRVAFAHREGPAGGGLVVRGSRTRGEQIEDALRRGFDILLSAVALALLTPVFAVVAILVKTTSAGPVLYRQVRVGRNRRRAERRGPDVTVGPHDRRRSDRRAAVSHGRPFVIHKFRTMVVDAEEYGPQWSSEGDPRITAIGRLLRVTRLDETPQFVNVLEGHMSVVGPRPERPFFVDQFAERIPRYVERLSVRPGITGRAQVTLDYDTCLEDVKKKLEADLAYVRNRSIWTDLCILARTVRVIVTGKGAC